MLTRRTVLRLAGTVPAAALVGACTSRTPTAPRPPDLLVVQTAAGVALVDARGDRIVVPAAPGQISYDRLAFAAARHRSGGTNLDERLLSGDILYNVDLPGDLSVRVVSPSGMWVALVEGAHGIAGPGAAGREETTIVVANSSGEVRRLTVPGCVEPEAFTVDGTHLYMLDYLPPLAPDRYRVRMIEIATGQATALLTRDKRVIPPGAEEEMRGEGRQAVYGQNRRMLFSLYSHQPDHVHTRDLISARVDHPDVHAFVHCLSTDGWYAYCVDLPAPFGGGDASGHAIALAPVGEHPYVVDTTSGTVAAIDAGQLTVRSTGGFAPAGHGATAALVTSAGRQLVVATGSTVQVLDADKLSTVARWELPAPAQGVALTGDRLWIGRRDGAVAYDLTGREIAAVSVPGLASLVAART
jgi:hypothetical protein